MSVQAAEMLKKIEDAQVRVADLINKTKLTFVENVGVQDMTAKKKASGYYEVLLELERFKGRLESMANDLKEANRTPKERFELKQAMKEQVDAKV